MRRSKSPRRQGSPCPCPRFSTIKVSGPARQSRQVHNLTCCPTSLKQGHSADSLPRAREGLRGLVMQYVNRLPEEDHRATLPLTLKAIFVVSVVGGATSRLVNYTTNPSQRSSKGSANFQKLSTETSSPRPYLSKARSEEKMVARATGFHQAILAQEKGGFFDIIERAAKTCKSRSFRNKDEN